MLEQLWVGFGLCRHCPVARYHRVVPGLRLVGLKSGVNQVVETLLAGAVSLKLERSLLADQALHLLHIFQLGLPSGKLKLILLILLVNLGSEGRLDALGG